MLLILLSLKHCAPCRLAKPRLQAVADQYGLTLLTIDYHSPLGKQYAEALHLKMAPSVLLATEPESGPPLAGDLPARVIARTQGLTDAARYATLLGL